MRKPLLWFWAAWLLTGFGFEVWAVWGRPAPDDTLSEFTWYVVRGQTVGGFLFLTGLLVFLAWWFPTHVRELKGRKAPARVLNLGDRLNYEDYDVGPVWIYVGDDDADHRP